MEDAVLPLNVTLLWLCFEYEGPVFGCARVKFPSRKKEINIEIKTKLGLTFMVP